MKRMGSVLAGAAILVSIPRHFVAQQHQAGMAAPVADWWAILVGVSSIAWAVLEAATFFYLWEAHRVNPQKRLVGVMAALLASIALTNAPSLVADSAGLTLTGLLGVASLAHWTWAASVIGSTLFVILAAGMADAAVSKDARKDERIAVLAGDLSQIQAELTQARALLASQPQPAPIAVYEQQPPMAGKPAPNRGQMAPNQGDTPPTLPIPQTAAEKRLYEALVAHPGAEHQEIAAKIGVKPGAVRMNRMWKERKAIWAGV